MTGRTHSRRTVLTTGAAVAGTAFGAAALTACSGEDSSPGGNDQPDGSVSPGTELASLDDVPVGSATSVTTPDGQEAILSRRAENEVTAFSAVCTHQGCTVVAEQSELRCPCHNSTFDPFTGAVRGGPAEAPLPGIEVAIEGDRIVTR
ncbi:Rieske (2Fe-2S) protein [Saccharomonospora piscinae]|uniref:Cytochrome bc1 complex Rieske iron-sulfur subunit n=1 Tax=Saccharomonospora piscinae TaxID=687388 RepID=A0A1V9ADG4_SACPI|nr:Rieske (2Fe-2S) protein [Saccharomonospora piscinae]OQO95165.1 ferredoxin [Saccharomonospora piscinae]TLW94379.1 Rieske (2Fe-2S) protein [Saccharomonospora piscinae]